MRIHGGKIQKDNHCAFHRLLRIPFVTRRAMKKPKIHRPVLSIKFAMPNLKAVFLLTFENYLIA